MSDAHNAAYPKILLVVAVIGLIGAFFALDLDRYFDLSYIQANKQRFQDFYEHNTLLTVVAYMGTYILMAALSLPGAAVMTLLGGALFGFWPGLVMVSFSSTIGATLAFLAARFLFRDPIQRRFGDKLAVINRGIEEEGAFYLFTMRLIPAIPFFVINLVMGLTPIKTLTYFFVSQIGMLAGTAVYVNAGVQIGEIRSLSDILSPGLIFSFVLLGIFPLVVKKIMNMIKARRAIPSGP